MDTGYLEQARTAVDAADIALDKLADTTPAPAQELAVYIVDNASYNTTLTTRLITYLKKIASSDLRRVIVFQNKQQMAAGFMQAALDLDLDWDADSMWSVWFNTNPAERATYLGQAEKLNVQAYRFDDAHNNTPEELAAAVRFMRDYTDKPVIGTFGALDQKTVTDPKTGKKTTVPIDMPAYVHAGLTIFRQFYRHEQVAQTPKNPTKVVSTWLESGRIIDGVDLEAFQEGNVTTSVSDFDSMLLRCLAGGIRQFTVYAPVNESGWQMWSKAPELWQAVERAAVMLRGFGK